jgi:hypothetical protein
MVSAWLLAGCSSPKKIDVGGTCILNSDCNSPLLCTDSKCHDACHASVDCPPGETCVKTNDTSICQLPAEADCARTPCSSAYVCASDLRCRTVCQSAVDCAGGQVCVTSVCADPDELDKNTGQLPQKSPSLAADGGADAQATATGGTGGGAGPGGASGTSGGAEDAAAGGGGANDAATAPGGAGGSSSGAGGSSGAGDATATGGATGAAAAGGTKDAASGSGGAVGSSGGATARAGGTTATPDAGAQDVRPADAPADAKAPTPDTAPPTPLDGGASTVLTGCGRVTTQRYFCDDFESGLDQWHYASDGWGLTTTTFQSASHSATDSPNGNYPAGAKSEITMVNSVDLTGAVSPVVTFWHKLAIASGTSGYVDVSADAGSTWTLMTTFTSSSNTSVWSFQQLPLTSYVGKRIRLRFRLATGTTAGDGWYVDDIEVRETDLPPTGVPDASAQNPVSPQRYFFDDFESGLDNWHYATEGWGLDATTSQSATHSVTDSPVGNYPVGAKSEITMVSSANLTGAVSPVVTFWHKLDFGSSSDYTYVDASSDGGTTWTLVTKFDNKSDTSVWSFQQLSLAFYAGKRIKLRFRLEASGSTTGDGWHIDDVEIREAELPPGSVPDPGSQNPIAAEPTGCESGPATGRYFCEDFEAGLSSWAVATDGWNTVVATSQSPTHSVTDSPNGNYPAGAKSDMTMVVSVDLTGAVFPVLTYWHKLSLGVNSTWGCDGDSSDTDFIYIDASSDGGTTWAIVAQGDCTTSTSVWNFHQFSLAPYAGKRTRLRFRLDGPYGGADGWYVDDIKIRENEFVPAPSDLVLCGTQAAGAACHVSNLCGKTCGPDLLGSKSLTCPAGTFVESACTFPSSADYSCYKVGAAAACPSGTKAGQACTATACQACGATTGTGYLDASGAAKQGFCVCSKGVWSCGTTAEWPCYPATSGATVPASCN